MRQIPSFAPRFRVRFPTALRTLLVVGVATVLFTAPGCGGGGTGDEGTVDLVKAQEAAASNPAIAKKSARLGGGLTESPTKKATKSKSK